MRVPKHTAPGSRRGGVITSLAANSGRSDRVVVYLEGSRAFDVAAVVADRAGLRVGDTLAPDTEESLVEQDAPYRARDRALRLLALRDRSCQEVDLRLRRAGFDPAVVSETVAWLQDLDYLNDKRFAAGYAGEKLRNGWGERRIRSELLRKGVEPGAIEAALGADEASADNAAEGLEAVITLARRRFAKQFETDPEGAARRLAGFLGRRGYDWDTIHSATRIIAGEAGQGGAPGLP